MKWALLLLLHAVFGPPPSGETGSSMTWDALIAKVKAADAARRAQRP